MKKLTIVLVFIFTLLIMGCNKKLTSIELVFETDAGFSLEPITITDDQELNLPSLTKEGYTFIGWFLDNNVWKKPVTKDIFEGKNKVVNIYPKWQINKYIITFEDDLELDNLNIVYNGKIELATPTKEGKEFVGWYLDKALTNAFNENSMPANNITLYAKWKDVGGSSNDEPGDDQPGDDQPGDDQPGDDQPGDDEPGDDGKRTEEIWVFKYLFGNSNGNLNNEGLAVYYDTEQVHFYSLGNSVYQFDPKTNKTTILFTLGDNSRATYLNLNRDELYFIESNSKHIMKYDLKVEELSTVFENEYCYMAINSNHIYTLKLTEQNNEVKQMLNTYNVKTNALIKEDFTNIEFISPDSTKVYYKAFNTVRLNMMNYDGRGKTTVVYLDTFDVSTIYEVIFYKVEEVTPHYALVVDFENEIHYKGLYFYNDNSLDEVLLGNIHSLNYDNKNLFVIKDDKLIQISLDSLEIITDYDVSSNSKNIQIINYWIYYSVGSDLYRIDPITKKAEKLMPVD